MPDTEAHSQRGVLSLVGRALLTSVFFTSVPAHFGPVDLGFARAAGVPLANVVVPATGLLAFIGAASVLLGYRARLGAWLLILFLMPVTFVMHNFWAASEAMKPLQIGMFFRNLSIIGGLLYIAQYGGGAWSLDARRKPIEK